jgi:hypothetical protein
MSASSDSYALTFAIHCSWDAAKGMALDQIVRGKWSSQSDCKQPHLTDCK